MQFRLTLSEDDAIESRICGEAKPLNVRRRAEYLRRLLVRGYLAEREDIDKLGGFQPAAKSRIEYSEHDYNKSSIAGNMVPDEKIGGAPMAAGSLGGIFGDQAAGAADEKKGSRNEG